jgi:hypothetical protein
MQIDVASSDPAIATAVWEDDGLEIVGRGEGVVMITVSAGELATTLDVLITPAVDEPGPPTRTTAIGETDTDTDGDTDTDTDGDSDTDVAVETETETDTDTDTQGTTGG